MKPADRRPGTSGSGSNQSGASRELTDWLKPAQDRPGWTRDPFLLWIGHEVEAPACPARAPNIGYEGHADLVREARIGARTRGALAAFGEPDHSDCVIAR